jgi:origin recognition complex subunit 3
MDQDEEKCYVYTPAKPATKRRKLQPKEVDASWKIRQDTYRELWNDERSRIQTVIDKANGTTLDEIVKLLDGHEQDPHSWCIPAAFVLAGPDYSFQETFFNQLGARVQARPPNAFALLSSEDCPNFKALLKTLVGKVTGDDENPFNTDGVRLLDYDIQVVQEQVKQNGKDMLILAIQDSESFPENVLAELIELLWYFRRSILVPF